LRRVICDVRTKQLYVVSGIERRHVIKTINKCRLATIFSSENLVCRRPVFINSREGNETQGVLREQRAKY